MTLETSAPAPVTATPTAPSQPQGITADPTSRRGALAAALEYRQREKTGPTEQEPEIAARQAAFRSRLGGDVERGQVSTSAYAQLHEQAIAARQITSDDARLDQTIRDFTSRHDVDYFDERGVLEIWLKLGPTPANIEKAWKQWRKENLTLDAAKRDTVGARGPMITTPAVNARPRIDGTLATMAELRRREERYRVRREPRPDAKTKKGAFDAALDLVTRSKSR